MHQWQLCEEQCHSTDNLFVVLIHLLVQGCQGVASEFRHAHASARGMSPILVGSRPGDEDLHVTPNIVRGASRHLGSTSAAQQPSAFGTGVDVDGLFALDARIRPAPRATVVPSQTAQLAVSQVDNQIQYMGHAGGGRIHLRARYQMRSLLDVIALAAIQGKRRVGTSDSNPSVDGHPVVCYRFRLRALQNQFCVLLHLYSEDHFLRWVGGQEEADWHLVADSNGLLWAQVAQGQPRTRVRAVRVIHS
mmetsp:Transcript_50376/g.144842  ORF Transcript_50376/g.144842 Transcript_50376/m.144842 type:complete len:248 (-) Transcript_50376:122-865(-)